MPDDQPDDTGEAAAPGPVPGPLGGPLGAMLGEMAGALAEEAKHAQNEASWVRIRNGRRLRAGLGRFLYCFDGDADTWFPAGSTAELSIGEDEPAAVEVLEVRAATLWLESPADLGAAIASARIRSNPWYLLDALRTRLDELRGVAPLPEGASPPTAADLRLIACLLGLVPPRPGTPVDPAEVAAGYVDLPANPSQLAAVGDCLGSELRFVWGPPGTGKTETLGLLAAEAFLRGESVLVVAHSNAAVDAAAIALCRNLIRADPTRDSGARGEALRAGEPVLAEALDLPVTERGVLGRSRPELLARLLDLEGRGGVLMDNQDSLFGEDGRGGAGAQGTASPRRVAGRELARVTEDLRKVREAVARALQQLLGGAQLVLATLSRAAITPEIFERRFDRVLVDEASMAMPPQVAFAASLASRGPKGSVAVFGDFRQLAPVVSSWAAPVKRWLGRDVFEIGLHLGGVTRAVDGSPILSVLDTQYRMHPAIMGIVNGPSYGGRLKAGPGVAESTALLAGHPPLAGYPVVWLDTGELGARGFATRTHSRMNPLSAWAALRVAAALLEGGMQQVGIVTPYRDQARLLRLLVRGADLQGVVHTGTIHRFQGGERDAIILDLVDSSPQQPGTLFRSDDGLRLLNVAVTRARGKLVCLSDGAYLKRSAQSPVWTILGNLCRSAAPLDPGFLAEAPSGDQSWSVLRPSADTAHLLEHDASQATDLVVWPAGLPLWAAALVSQRVEGVRREEAGARLVLLPTLAWLFPKQEPWALRISDPQCVKQLVEAIGTPAAPGAARPRPAPATSPPTPAPGGPSGSLGRCRACPGELALRPGPGGAPRIACAACGAFERDAEPPDLTTTAASLGMRCSCGQELRGRRGPSGMFLGCSAYPNCRNTRQVRSLFAP